MWWQIYVKYIIVLLNISLYINPLFLKKGLFHHIYIIHMILINFAKFILIRMFQNYQGKFFMKFWKISE